MPPIADQLAGLRNYYEKGATYPLVFRKEQLKKLKAAILDREEAIYEALYADLKKSREEAWVTEIGIVISEINTAIRHLSSWMAPEPVATNLVNLPSTSKIVKEPRGVVLIISPWNYPFQLLLAPLVGAIAAGNCAVIKPTEFAPATAAVIEKICKATFSVDYILYVNGDGAMVIPAMMHQFAFDHVLYTGSTAVGKLIYKMAAEKLVPVTLELGGKSPCVIEKDANITVAARRIAITKFSNAGQTCTAPDYILVHESCKEKFINALQAATVDFFSEKPEESYNYGKIINEKQFDRVSTYLSQGTIVYGGRSDKGNLFIEPTILTSVALTAPVMEEEIFGPVLPVLSFTNLEEAKVIIARNPNPLAFYIYTSSERKANEWIKAIPSGGACINNSSWHFTNHHLPFGGRGMSGMGSCHGKFSFDTFTHKKAVMKTPTWFDPAMKYPPFKGKLKLFKWFIR